MPETEYPSSEIAALMVGRVGDVIRYRYLSPGEATRCLTKDSDICTLAKALCLG